LSFDVNSIFLFIAAGIVILYVLAQSVFFLIKAWRRGKEIGLDVTVMKKALSTSAVFTIAPSVAILIGVITLSKKLGIPLPWLRLSVIGALTYELTAAETAATAVGASMSESSIALTAAQYAAIAWVMTLGIIIGLILVPLLCRKILSGMQTIKSRDQKWSEAFSTALFLGMISAFLGVIFANITEGLSGWIPVFVMLVSAIIMAVIGVLVKKFKIRWLEDYALPLSMVGGMIMAIPITNLVSLIV
jgi:hypothetical protein